MAHSQKRLSLLDEVRQVAKTVVEIRKEKERQKLGKEVATRAQQAEANRMLMLKAYRQRRASLMERSSMSLVRKMAWENKYKERVRAAISQKRAAAEKKRLSLLEAEIKRARARVLQARHVAKSVSQQRELERREMRDKLEDRMQRVCMFISIGITIASRMPWIYEYHSHSFYVLVDHEISFGSKIVSHSGFCFFPLI